MYVGGLAHFSILFQFSPSQLLLGPQTENLNIESTDTHILMEIYSASFFFFVSIFHPQPKLNFHLEKTIRREESFSIPHIHTRTLRSVFFPFFFGVLMFVLLLTVRRDGKSDRRHIFTYFNNFLLLMRKNLLLIVFENIFFSQFQNYFLPGLNLPRSCSSAMLHNGPEFHFANFLFAK